MTATTPARPILGFQNLVDQAIRKTEKFLDSTADLILKKVVKVEPHPEPEPDPVAATNVLSDEYEESGFRMKSGFKQDDNWAIPHMWVEMTAGGIGAGTFLASLAASNPAGMTVGFALTAVMKGILLWADLGRPDRVWRVFAQPNKSWIARGSWAFAAFCVFGGISTLAALLSVGGTGVMLSSIVAIIASLVLLVYDGFFLNDSTGVAGWRSSVLPFWFATNSSAAGVALTALLGSASTGFLRLASALFGIAGAMGYAYLRDLLRGGASARTSARQLTDGDQKIPFVVGAGILGSGVPAMLSGMAAIGVAPTLNIFSAAALGVIGVYYSRQSTLSSGVHTPVF